MKETSTPMPGRGGQIWRESRELAMATVRDWHPNCETCKHAEDLGDQYEYVNCGLFDGVVVEKTHGCLAHTDYAPPTGGDTET
jgi:hypothetical protein